MLERWEPRIFHKPAAQGRSQPLIISCVCLEGAARGARADFFVKVLQARTLPLDLYCDALGNLLGSHFGIATPQPVIVDINPAFAGYINRLLPNHGVRYSLAAGEALGTRLIEGLRPIETGRRLSSEMLNQALLLYALDVVTVNSDRVPKNHNCGIAPGNILTAYDFGLCFAGLRRDYHLEPWDILTNPVARDHLFYESLQGRTHDVSGFVGDLNAVTKDALIKMTKNIPDGWRTHEERIFEHMAKARSRAELIGEQLCGVLG